MTRGADRTRVAGAWDATRAEVLKLGRSRAVLGTAVLGAALPPALAALNATTVRTARAAGRAAAVTDDIRPIGVQECMLAAACCAALGALAVGAEYRALDPDRGGGRQATTTALAVPGRIEALAAKLVALTGLLALVAGAAAGGALLAAHRCAGELAVPLDGSRWGVGACAAAYVAGTGLLAFGAAALLRNGLVPLVYLVAGSTVVSPGLLLTRVTRWGWLLPESAGVGLLRVPSDNRLPPPQVCALVLGGWVLALLVAAGVAQRRRDA